MIIGSFGNVNFEISEQNVFSINNELNRIFKSKITEHNPIYGPGMQRHQGRELIEVTLSINLITSLVKSPQKELENLKMMLEIGEYNFLILGGQIVGEHPFLITEISEKNQYFNKDASQFDYIELSISIKEYIEDLKLYHKNLENKKVLRTELQNIKEESAEEVAQEQEKVVSK